jgi:glutaredoxin
LRTQSFAERTVAELIIYTVPGCNTCVRAVRELTEEGVEFEERDIHKNAHWLEEASKLGVTVPILVRGDSIEIGWRGDVGCLFQ